MSRRGFALDRADEQKQPWERVMPAHVQEAFEEYLIQRSQRKTLDSLNERARREGKGELGASTIATWSVDYGWQMRVMKVDEEIQQERIAAIKREAFADSEERVKLAFRSTKVLKRAVGQVEQRVERGDLDNMPLFTATRKTEEQTDDGRTLRHSLTIQGLMDVMPEFRMLYKDLSNEMRLVMGQATENVAVKVTKEEETALGGFDGDELRKLLDLAEREAQPSLPAGNQSDALPQSADRFQCLFGDDAEGRHDGEADSPDGDSSGVDGAPSQGDERS